ncbi:hypothetical protein GZ982_02225 [Pseudomonas fluorescens]|nr:hypothetical protein GZ982_02225 [Pseudomonas fluorescens]
MTSFRLYLPPPKSSTDGQLSNWALIIAGMASPIVDGDGGIGLGVVEDHEEGAFCIIDPWSAPMQAGDIVDVYLDANVVWHHELLVGQENERLFFFVGREWFVPGWIERCYYVVLRKGETIPDDPSSTLRLLVKLDRPGGRDKNPHLPGHSELKIVQLPAEVIAQGVDAQWAARGVPMAIEPYPNIAVRDVIQVKWGSVFLDALELTQEQVEGTQPIEVIADQAKILAGGDSNALLVQYEVHDEVWNYSEKWSMTTTVKVDAGAWRLVAPIIEDAVDGVIDLKALNQQDVTVQILLATQEFEVGDTVTMTWIGTPQVGKPLIHTQAHEITNIPSILPLKVPYAEVRAIAMGSAEASYVLTKKNGDPPLSSKRAFASVVGDVYAHPAPVLREQVGDSLDPDTQMANVLISYPGIANGDFIELIWEGTRADGTPYAYPQTHTVSRNEADDKSVTLYVGAEHISVLANGRLDLWYQVSNDQAAIYGVSESEHLLVKVQAPGATLPPPKVPEAPDGVLDPSKIFDKVKVLVDYRGTVKGDILTYYWTGANPLASTSSWIPITAVSAGEPVTFRVDADFVTGNIGQTVKVRYTLKHASGAYSYSETLDLLIGFLVGELPPPKVIQAPDTLLDPMNALAGVDIEIGYESMDPALDTVILKWLGTPGPGSSEDQEQPGDQSGKVRFHLDASFVGPNIGRVVSVGYEVQRYGFFTPSESLPLTISAFADPETQLPHPRVTQANADRQELNLATFSGNAEATVGKWSFSAAGQKVWLRLEGQTDNATSYDIVLLAGATISAGQASNGLRESVLRNELEKLGHNTPLKVVCRVSFSGEADEAAAIECPITQYTFKVRHDWVVPDIQRVYDTWGDISEGDYTVDTRVTLSGVATPESTLEFFDDSAGVGTASVALESDWTFPLSGLQAKDYRLTAQARDGSGNVSNRRTFTAVRLVPPTLDSVTDSRGELANGDTTVDTRVTVAGKASAMQRVEIFDDATASLGDATANAAGDWTRDLSALSVTRHSLTAKALYGAGVVSGARTFTVTALMAPSINSVQDSKGELNNGDTTVDTRVTLTGKASIEQEVEIFDNLTASQGRKKTDSNGNWDLVISGLSVTGHSLTAKALYGTGQASAARTFTVTALTVPSITLVRDSRGELNDGDTTVDTRVTLTGKASIEQEVEIFDNLTVSHGRKKTDSSGNWTLDISGLSVTGHSLTAKALYGSGQMSTARTFTVTALAVPSITSVRDSKGELDNGDTTVDTRVTLTGKASIEQEVEIFDNLTVSHGRKKTDNNGNWDLVISGLSETDHSLTVKALYGSGATSTARTFTVTALDRPTIASVRDSKGEVRNGGTTLDTRVTLAGKASVRQEVEIFDNLTVSHGRKRADDNGDWDMVVSGLSMTNHSFTAKAIYGDGASSEARTFKVTAVLTPTLTDITDSRGSVVGKATVETRVTVTGTGSSGQRIQLRDAEANIGSPIDIPDSATTWTADLTGLTVKGYTIKAKALYDNGQESGPLAFSVTASVTPTLTDITDSQGSVVGKTTIETRVTVTGTGSSGQGIQLRDANANIGSPIDIPANATTWTANLTGLTPKGYSIKAKALYGSGQESGPLAFSVTAGVTPTITDITDSRGSVVGKTTIETRVTVSGTGSSGQSIQLRDGNANIGSPIDIPANTTTWTAILTGLSVKGYDIKAKALYGSGQESAAKAFFVTANISPTLTDIRDSKGSVVGGITVETSVRVTGTGSSGQRIQLRDGNANIGNPIDISAVGTNWEATLTGLSAKAYGLKAKALYGNGQESAEKGFTVTAVRSPTITFIRNAANVDIPPNGSTTDTQVTVVGNASSLQHVKILDNGGDKGDAQANAAGDWSKVLAGLAVGAHPMTVRALYGSGVPDSAVRTFHVAQALPPLVFNTSPVTLSGRIYIIYGSHVLPTFGAGTSVLHQASGGRPGYSYRSSNAAVAVVDGNGWVTVRSRGQTTITARDAAGQEKSYSVSVTGVILCEGVGGGTWPQINSNTAARGARMPSMGELREIYNTYGNRWPLGNGYYWCKDVAATWPVTRYYMKNLVNGTEAHVQYYGNAFGVGLK